MPRTPLVRGSRERMKQAVETREVSAPRRRIARGVLRDLPAPEGEALRPLARALVDLAIALSAEENKEEGKET